MVFKSKLNLLKENCKGCGMCVLVCPFKVLEMSKDFNTFGDNYVINIPNKDCRGCGRCYIICPDCAIEVINE
jgi:2-oxoglutarate ferredoxin oxidoreductase subunit delta